MFNLSTYGEQEKMQNSTEEQGTFREEKAYQFSSPHPLPMMSGEYSRIPEPKELHKHCCCA